MNHGRDYVPLEQARQQGRGGALKLLHPIAWQDQPIPERKWIVPNFIPSGTVTMLSGDGGLGKSLLTLQLLVACALGRQWLGIDALKVKGFGLYCEDEAEELHRRLADISRAEGFELGDLEDVTLVSRVGEASELLRRDKYNRVTGPSQLYDDMRRAILASGAQLVIVDSLHDLFDGNENSRTEARSFIGVLRKIALEIDGAVVLCAHPSVAGLTSGTGTAGSTAWNNAVRSRFYLTTPKDDEDEDPDIRVLERKKGNYAGRAAKGDSIKIRWEAGRFVRVVQGGAVERIENNVRLGRAKGAFLAALDTMSGQGRTVTDSKNSPKFAPKIFASLPECKGVSTKALTDAMEALFSDGVIKVGVAGHYANRTPISGIIRAP